MSVGGGKALLALLGVALALGVAGCGDSGDGDGGGPQAAGEAQGGNGEQEQAAALMREVTRLYNEADGAGLCSSFTAAGREEVVRAGADYGIKGRDCVAVMDEIARSVVRAEVPPRVVEVRQVTVDGDRARVVVKGGIAGIRSVVPYRLVRAGGEWRIDDPISARRRIIRVESGPPRSG